jgi:hypothetical protein
MPLFYLIYFKIQAPFYSNSHLPPAARGALFEKTAPLDPPQKLLIKGQSPYHASYKKEVDRQVNGYKSMYPIMQQFFDEMCLIPG